MSAGKKSKFMAARLGASVLAFVASGIVAGAACYTPQQQLPVQSIGAFSGNPSDMLRNFPEGGSHMLGQVRDLAASDPATLPLILGLIANANKDQKAAIGAGLAQAARICVRTDQAYATEIQQAIAQTKDQDVVLAYAGMAGDQPTGSTGAGFSGGAAGGQTNPLAGTPTGTGGPQGIGNAGVNTGQFTITSSVTGTSGFGVTSTRVGLPASQ